MNYKILIILLSLCIFDCQAMKQDGSPERSQSVMVRPSGSATDLARLESELSPAAKGSPALRRSSEIALDTANPQDFLTGLLMTTQPNAISKIAWERYAKAPAFSFILLRHPLFTFSRSWEYRQLSANINTKVEEHFFPKEDSKGDKNPEAKSQDKSKEESKEKYWGLHRVEDPKKTPIQEFTEGLQQETVPLIWFKYHLFELYGYDNTTKEIAKTIDTTIRTIIRQYNPRKAQPPSPVDK